MPLLGRTCRRTLSIEELPDPFFAFGVNQVRDGGIRGFPLIDPDAVLFFERGFLADGTQGDTVSFGFHEQVIAWLHAQFLADGFGKDYATGFVDGDFGSHRWHYTMDEPRCKWHSSRSKAG